MKNKQLSFVVLLLAASAAYAENYPAADFQPKVIYQDPSVVNTAAADKCAPQQEAAKKEQSVEFDAKYPATSFQPKVIYSAAGS